MAYPSPNGTMSDLGNPRRPSTAPPSAGGPLTPDEYARWYAQQGGSAPAPTNPNTGVTRPGTTPPSTTPPTSTTQPVGDPDRMSDLGTKYGYSKAPVGSAPTDRGSGTGFGGYAYGGFDFNQDEANRYLGKSPKYTLAEATRLAGEAGAGDAWKTKAGAEAYAQQWIQPLFEANGIEVLDIQGEKIQVRDHYGTYWVDWVKNADGANPEIQWLPEGSEAAFGSGVQRYAPDPFTPTSQGGVDPTSMTPEQYAAWYAEQQRTPPAPIDPYAYEDLARTRI